MKMKLAILLFTFVLALSGCEASGLQASDKDSATASGDTIMMADANVPEPKNTPALTEVPTSQPTDTPAPTEAPTPEPTPAPTPQPTDTPAPTEAPTPEPTATPAPTEAPTPEPTATPAPTEAPTPEPTAAPTSQPAGTNPGQNSGAVGSGGDSNYNTYNNTDQQNTTATYVLNTSSKKIHHPSCSSVPKIAPHNYATSSESLETLKSQGYDTCKRCF